MCKIGSFFSKNVNLMFDFDSKNVIFDIDFISKNVINLI